MQIHRKIPFFSLQEQHHTLKGEILTSIEKLIDQSHFILSEELKAFENRFAAYCQNEYCVGVSNGTVALVIALESLGIGVGDEVIVPAATFAATALAVVKVGAKPVFADIDAHTWLIDPEEVRKKITYKTKAIIGVHLYGNPCKMDVLQQIAQENNLFLIEDAAQAHGALLQNKKMGAWSDMACFSFYPSKNLGAMGDAGAVVCSSKDLYQQCCAIRNCGKNAAGEFVAMGLNYRMSSIQAVILEHKLNYLDGWNKKRTEIAEKYKFEVTNERLQFQETTLQADRVYHLSVVKADNRQKLIAHLNENNVSYGLHYEFPAHKLPSFSKFNHVSLPITEDLFSKCVSIPLYPEMEHDDVERVIEVLNAY